eukprot:TRINITY_DN28206_c0_g1_i2.p1 TRINITY_DN28206_c0_g1~~TRINITY_DN28206_c0_g1_i2.p1  ORF type:complete len:321 (-),score=78.55 TRINITY_DN28206_c0_g1_i2:59-1021(-)
MSDAAARRAVADLPRSLQVPSGRPPRDALGLERGTHKVARFLRASSDLHSCDRLMRTKQCHDELLGSLDRQLASVQQTRAMLQAVCRGHADDPLARQQGLRPSHVAKGTSLSSAAKASLASCARVSRSAQAAFPSLDVELAALDPDDRQWLDESPTRAAQLAGLEADVLKVLSIDPDPPAAVAEALAATAAAAGSSSLPALADHAYDPAGDDALGDRWSQAASRCDAAKQASRQRSQSHGGARVVELKPFVCEEATGDCPCCLAPLQKGDSLLAFPCAGKHIFHTGCLHEWLRKAKDKSTCPMCRSWPGERSHPARSRAA